MDCQTHREYVRIPRTSLLLRREIASTRRQLTLNLCSRSDADSDVLADYVIALLRHDGDQAAVRKLCEEEIPDFLTEGQLRRARGMRVLANHQRRPKNFPRRCLPGHYLQIIHARRASSTETEPREQRQRPGGLAIEATEPTKARLRRCRRIPRGWLPAARRPSVQAGKTRWTS